MATEHHDEKYGERTIVRVIVLIAALMAIGVFIIPNVHDGGISATGWGLLAIWSVVLIAGTIWASRVQRHYRCPKCGARLPMLPPEASTNYQHRFHCTACDVVWTTNVYVGDA